MLNIEYKILLIVKIFKPVDKSKKYISKSKAENCNYMDTKHSEIYGF